MNKVLSGVPKDVSEKYLIELKACPCCNSLDISKCYDRGEKNASLANDKFFFDLIDIPAKHVRYDFCKQCGLLFLNPRWNNYALSKMYGPENLYRKASLMMLQRTVPQAGESDLFRSIDNTIDLLGKDRVHRGHWKRAHWIKENILKSSRGALTVADVGAGFGAAQRALCLAGFNYIGYDSSPDLCEFAGKIGRKVSCVDFDGLPEAIKEKVDIVYTSQFMEHVDSLSSCMDIINTILIGGEGYLFIDVPTFRVIFPLSLKTSLSARESMNWGHMNHFDHISLGNLMRKHGFSPVAHSYENGDIYMLARVNAHQEAALLYSKPSIRFVRLNIDIGVCLFRPLAEIYYNIRHAVGLYVRALLVKAKDIIK